MRSSRRHKTGAGFGIERALRTVANTLSPSKTKNAEKGGKALNNSRVLGRDGILHAATPRPVSDEIQGKDICIGYSGFDGDDASKVVSESTDTQSQKA